MSQSAANSSRPLNELADVGPMSLSDDKTYSFKPENLSDVTIHYRAATFHMHQYVLTTQSKFFAAALSTDRDEPCSICPGRPSIPHHRCITLPGGRIGGVEITISIILAFFRRLYATIDDSNEPQGDEAVSRIITRWPRHYYLTQITSVDPVKDEATLDCYEHDDVHSKIFKSMTVSVGPDTRRKVSSYKVGQWFYSVGLAEHPNYHLADYFQCDALMKRYGKQLETIIPRCQQSTFFDQAWRILVLTERYNWPAVRAACIKVCAADHNCHLPTKLPRWKTIASKLKNETMMAVFIASKQST